MPFTVNEYLDLVRLLAERPEWRDELRRLLLSDDFLSLPQVVRELAEAQARTETQVQALAEAQRRTEARLSRIEEHLAALAEAQARSEARLSRVEEHLAALAEAQRRTEGHLEALAEFQRTMADEAVALEASHKRLTDTVGDLKGRMLEMTYREKATAYFGPLLRRLRVVAPYSLEEALLASLSPDEFKDVLLLDLLLCGQPRERHDAPEAWLAVEISSVVDLEDVERARRRAALLRRAGFQTIPVVAGEQATLGAEADARTHSVVVMQDGRTLLWEEALQAWAGP